MAIKDPGFQGPYAQLKQLINAFLTNFSSPHIQYQVITSGSGGITTAMLETQRQLGWQLFSIGGTSGSKDMSADPTWAVMYKPSPLFVITYLKDISGSVSEVALSISLNLFVFIFAIPPTEAQFLADFPAAVKVDTLLSGA